MKTHREIDAHSLAMHRLAVRKLREEPERFERVKENLRRWRPEISPRALSCLEAWNGKKNT
jgi:hypothetical protein